jgi:hypothetical protein
MTLKRIRLELARTPEFPEGHPGCGYEFTAPLDRRGKLDTKRWAREKEHCGVRRFWQSTTDEHGSLVHHRGNQWAFAWRVARTTRSRSSGSASMRSLSASISP